MEHLAHRPSLWRRMGTRPCNALRDLPPRRTFHLVREGSREVSICEPAGAPGFSERSEQWEPLTLVGGSSDLSLREKEFSSFDLAL